jgi:hypothetical protein
MPANCARSNHRQDGTPAQVGSPTGAKRGNRRKHIFKVGDQCGAQVIKKLAGWSLARNSTQLMEPHYVCKCSKCGAVKNMREASLLIARATSSGKCKECWLKTKTGNPDAHTFALSTSKMCLKCCDLPWHRPRNKPCKCGKDYHAEVINIETYGCSPIAFAEEA